LPPLIFLLVREQPPQGTIWSRLRSSPAEDYEPYAFNRRTTVVGVPPPHRSSTSAMRRWPFESVRFLASGGAYPFEACIPPPKDYPLPVPCLLLRGFFPAAYSSARTLLPVSLLPFSANLPSFLEARFVVRACFSSLLALAIELPARKAARIGGRFPPLVRFAGRQQLLRFSL